jgi:hypothetical protein
VRRAIFVLAGAILFGSATFFYGMILFGNGWEGFTMKELAIWLVVVGATMGALFGLLAARVTAPSVSRRTRFLVFGTLAGLLAGLVYGFNVDEVCIGGGIDFDYCGWPFLWWALSPWISFALWTVAGGVVGGFLGVTGARLARGRYRSLPAGAGSS